MSHPRTDYQEPPNPTPAALLFVAVTLASAAPLYGYLLALRTLPPGLLTTGPGLPTSLVPFALAATAYLAAPRLRRARLPLRLLPLALAAGLAQALRLLPVVPERLPLVSPLAGLRVHRVYAEAGRLGDLLPLLAASALGAALLGAVSTAALRRRSRPGVAPIAHGSARWADERDVRRTGLLQPPETGLHLGYHDPARRLPLTDRSDHHVLAIAPPGLGKTTALVIPTLLRYPAPAWVLDPKGELWEATAGWRSAGLGHRCIRYAPTDPDSPRWNPLTAIPRGPGDVATASVLARNLVVASAEARETHWTLSARSLCAALALHVRYAPDVPGTMTAVRSLLSSRADHDDLFDELLRYPHDPDAEHAWHDPLTGEPTQTHPEVALLARRFRATPPRERGSIISTLQPFLDPWGDPGISRATDDSDFGFGPLLDGSLTTLYVSIPYHDLSRLAPLIRLQLAALGRKLTERSPESPHRLEVIVDEFAALGRLPIVEDLLAFFRGYNARFFLLLQGLSQLQRLYGLRESITDNCRVHLVTATESPSTRRHASSLAGTTTARYRRTTHSQQGGRLAPGSRRTVAMAENARPLVTEGEVGTLPLDQALVFKAGAPPIRSHLHPYYLDPDLSRRAATPAPPSTGPSPNAPDLPDEPAPPTSSSTDRPARPETR